MVGAGFGMGRRKTLYGAYLVLRANQKWAPYPDNDPDACRDLMRRFYLLVARDSRDLHIDPATAARLEVEWWRLHRAHQHDPGVPGSELEQSLVDLYAYLTTASDNRVVRFHLDPSGTGIYDLQVILEGLAKASIHDGGGLAFGPDGQLYVGVGDAGVPDRAQDPASLNGKILRMTTTGQPPLSPANPDPHSLVWSMGHRNVQGLAWDSSGAMYATEFGQNTWDEDNLIEPGKNYGWPVVEGMGDDPAYTNPVVTWTTDEASPSGIAIVGDVAYVGALRGQRLWRVPLDGGDPEPLLQDQYGRLRTVAVAPDGALWLTTSNTDGRGDARDGDDRILRFPAR
jgi:glucose/arabinose dehydrogenase